MSIKLETKFLEGFISDAEMSSMKEKAVAAAEKLNSNVKDKSQPVGWVTLPENYDKEEFARIKAAAKRIREMCDVFVVIGIGGSYLGARAAIEFVKGENHNLLSGKDPMILFAGNSIDSDSLYETVELCRGKRVAINVISKSGTTTEPAIAFRVFRELLEKEYGKEGSKERIFVTTDARIRPGTLKEFAEIEGYETFVGPDDIGGRYSVLSAVGLLPIAVAGCDIDAMMAGAQKAQKEFDNTDYETNSVMRYAAIRNILHAKGKDMEVFGAFVPDLRFTGEWLKQLFAESEGKENKGIFPGSVIYSTDLHSVGQYVQEGKRIIFQTVITLGAPRHAVNIPHDEANIDGIGYIEGKSLHYVNDKAFLGSMAAHRDGGIPNVILEMPRADEENFGYMVYFFEKACAVSGYILGINPFDQPGVEAYKTNMFRLLGKPGYEA